MESITLNDQQSKREMALWQQLRGTIVKMMQKRKAAQTSGGMAC